jgi:CHAT domain-containing protein
VGTFLLRNQDLVIEPDDQLGGLAFDALIDDRGGYFGDQRSLTLSLGPYYRKGHRLSAIGPDSRALVVVVRSSSADAGEALPSLPDAQREGYLIAGKFREAHILNDQEVNAGAVLERLAGSEIFHFAGHALSSPGRSGLLLSGSLLRASAFNESRVAKLQLAVLSTCDSEDGSNGSVLDGDSIARKLMGEGVPYVVASRWKVDSAATREFMNLFYDRVMAGDSIAQAMNRAQALLRSRPETAHPFYWSAFATFSST